MGKHKAAAVHHNKRKRKEFLVALLFIAPLVLLTVAVTFIPIGTAVKWSLHDTNYLTLQEFVGLDNYREIFANGNAWKSIWNSLWYVFGSLLLVFPVGIVLAVLLNQKLKGQAVFRTFIIIPWVISQTITAMLWRWIYNSSYGLLTYIFQELFGTRVEFLTEILPARLSVLVANFWNTAPIVIIMMLAALQGISADLYEAAKVDGSNAWQTFRKITLPLLKPTIAITLVMQSMEYFNMVTLLNTMTDGGPFKSTMTLSVYAYREGFIYWHVGTSSAISILILLLNMIFSVLYIKLMSSKES
ncbi:carbohydrate ABC transporter permease [Diplocloster modestus]|uniref:Sugar ABC transporter permease n=1 Tax=Diplocloster modestus TaxID=2850322 RepID=A0ABS6K4X1_9FIRM|nr:sugar ABC transporter permease [Diplocloster modestus]MBU9725501.1 sugar ABC transporter permease [Diplocloster modestus]